MGESTPTAALHVSGGTANIVAKFLSTDATASIELADNSTTNNVALTRTGQTLSLCNNGGAVQIGTALGGTSVTFSQSASDGATEGGNIISNTLQVGMEINTGVATQQEIGKRQTTTAYQVETGKPRLNLRSNTKDGHSRIRNSLRLLSFGGRFNRG